MTHEQLTAILEAHKLWVETDGRQGERANLRLAVLRGCDLREADLRGADLVGCDLSEATFAEGWKIVKKEEE